MIRWMWLWIRGASIGIDWDLGSNWDPGLKARLSNCTSRSRFSGAGRKTMFLSITSSSFNMIPLRVIDERRSGISPLRFLKGRDLLPIQLMVSSTLGEGETRTGEVECQEGTYRRGQGSYTSHLFKPGIIILIVQ